MLGVEVADLVMIDRDSRAAYRLALLPDGRVTQHDLEEAAFAPVRAELEATGEPVLFGADHPDRIARYLEGLDLGSGIVVPVESDDTLVGAIAVGNREGPAKTFHRADIELLRALAHQVAATLERAGLVQRLQEEISSNQDLIRSKDGLIAAVSHEMRTPLTAVLGYAEILGEQAVADADPERLEVLKAIVSEAANLDNIVEDLLTAARNELGEFSVAPRMIDVDQEVRTIVENSLDRAGIDTRISRARAYADPQRLGQIVRNLLENARRYGGDQILVEVDTAGQAARIRISDNGVGVPENRRDDLFKGSSNGRIAGVERPGAIGIGLPLSRRLAKMMGGNIVYYRDEGWTVFELSVPQGPTAR